MLRAQYASRDILNHYFKELATILTENNLRDKPERIYNIDEAGISTEHNPPKIVCNSASQPQSVTSPRSSTVTIIGGGNAIGNNIPPYFVFPGKRWNDEFLQGALPGSVGEMSDSGWSKTDVFYNYLTKHFIKHTGISADGKSPPTLILFDGHKSHTSLTLVEWAKKHNIILFLLPPHTSHVTQPLDVGVFGPFKSMYQRSCQQHLLKNPGVKMIKYDVARLTSLPYLKSMNPENLSSAFRKAGIYPFSNKIVPDSSVAPSIIYPTNENDKHQENTSVEVIVTSASTSTSSATPPPADLPSEAAALPTETAASGSGSGSGPGSASSSGSGSGSASKEPLTDYGQSFFQSRTITKVVSKPKKKFVTPYLAGCLMKKKNVDILKSSEMKKMSKQKTLKSSGKTTSIRKSTSTRAHATAKSTKKNPKSSRSSPQPGPSAFYVDDSENESDMSVSDEESDICCVCGKFSPPALKHSVNLVIVKWAQCDKCGHWTHLIYCTNVRVIRLGDQFMCPHCS